MSKSFAAGTAIGLAFSVIVGVAAGIMMIGSPTPAPRQTPAAVVQQLDPTTDTPTPATTTTEQTTVTTPTPSPATPPTTTAAETKNTEPPGATAYGPPAPSDDHTAAVMPPDPPDAFVAPSPTPQVTPENPPGVIETH